MDSRLNFATDAIVKDKAYPALAIWQAEPYTPAWRQFGQHWPYTVPCELIEHCRTHAVDYNLCLLSDAKDSAYYCVGLGFFDFDIDYFALIPNPVLEQNIPILFYYHEGDNPFRIQQRLDDLCQQHGLDNDCYRFVSGNTAAGTIRNFAWFPDHELLYWHRNRQVPATSIHLNQRTFRFTILNRTHKWWRATVMADLERAGILDVSQWSYNTTITIGDRYEDNPLQVDLLDLRPQITKFMQHGPYACDDFTSEQHNDHHLHVPQHFSQSYCHVVLETHFDADQSNGAFLTEKTFKPIKHGQPFVIVGAPGSLQALRDLGYRTFDHVIDNSYDLELDNTLRWQKALTAIMQISQQDPDAWLHQCLDDLCHNQQLFLSSKKFRLNMLFQRLRKQ
jgi:hypothetical protein